MDWTLLVKELNANVGIPLDVYAISNTFCVCNFFLLILASSQTSLLCIVCELARGGSVAVAVGVSDS